VKNQRFTFQLRNVSALGYPSLRAIRSLLPAAMSTTNHRQRTYRARHDTRAQVKAIGDSKIRVRKPSWGRCGNRTAGLAAFAPHEISRSINAPAMVYIISGADDLVLARGFDSQPCVDAMGRELNNHESFKAARGVHAFSTEFLDGSLLARARITAKSAGSDAAPGISASRLAMLQSSPHSRPLRHAWLNRILVQHLIALNINTPIAVH